MNVSKAGINPQWLITGEGDMILKDVTVHELDNKQELVKNKGVPFYNLDVTGSVLETFSDIQEKPEYFIDYKPFNDCIAYFPIYGNSMYPKYASGEIVAVKALNNFDTIQWGEAHLVITNANANNMRTIKLVHQHCESDKVILKSRNPNYNGEMIIDKKNIVNLFIIKGKITREQL